MKSRRRPHEDVTNQNMINRKRHGLWHSFIVNAQLSHLNLGATTTIIHAAGPNVKFDEAALDDVSVRHPLSPTCWFLSAQLRSLLLTPFRSLRQTCLRFFFLCFHIHITMRGEASWQTSITFTHTRTHAKKRTRANTLANKRFVTSAYKSIMNHRHIIFVAFGRGARHGIC